MKKTKSNTYLDTLHPAIRALIIIGKLIWVLPLYFLIWGKGLQSIVMPLSVIMWWILLYISVWLYALVVIIVYKYSRIKHPFYSLPRRELQNGLLLRIVPWCYMAIGLLVLLILLGVGVDIACKQFLNIDLGIIEELRLATVAVY